MQIDHPILQFKNVSISYTPGKNAVNHVNADIKKNRITAIMGPSGCGKSTLLRAINRMHELYPDIRISGEILMDNRNILKMNPMEVRRMAGMVFQRPNPFPTMSIFDNVIAGYKLNGIRLKKKEKEEQRKKEEEKKRKEEAEKERIRKEEAEAAAKAGETKSDGDTKTPVVDLEKYTVVFFYSGYMPNAYNMMEGKPCDSATGVKFSSAISAIDNHDARLGFDYVFVNGEESSVMVTVALYDEEGTQLSISRQIEVPIKRSMLTTVRGSFLMQNTGGGVAIDPGFEDEFNIYIP